MVRLTTLILAAVLAVACNSKSDGGGETEPAASEKAGDDPAGDEGEATDVPSAAGEGDSADEAAVADEEIPTAEDFEAEVAEEITEDSLEKELEALEQEIGD